MTYIYTISTDGLPCVLSHNINIQSDSPHTLIKSFEFSVPNFNMRRYLKVDKSYFKIIITPIIMGKVLIRGIFKF